MPKTKSHKGSAKRFKITASGKIKRTQSGKNHILNKKSRKTIRNLKKAAFVNKTQQKTIKKLIPYA